ncbi:uncharacterized protein B0H18DRAFT_184870, partial [Fomitopsis serialis]|uniref:uncharacterized protein n=1 Tax=Fomitopsis serialis TaxID=139415 RepID=UPI0020082A18
PGQGNLGEDESSSSRVQLPGPYGVAGTSRLPGDAPASNDATTRASSRAHKKEHPPRGLDSSDSGERRCSTTTDGIETEPARAQGGDISSTRGGTLLRGEGSGASNGRRSFHNTTSTSHEDVLASDPAATRTPSRELDVRATHGNSTRIPATRTSSSRREVQDTARVASTSYNGVLGPDVVSGHTSSEVIDVRASRRTSRRVPPVPRASSDQLEMQDTGDRRSHDITREASTSRREVLGLNRVSTALDRSVTVDVSRWPSDKRSREECFSLLADQLDHDFDEADVAASVGEWDIWAHCKRSALSCGHAIEEMSPRPGTYSRAARRAWDHFQRELEVVPLEFDPRLVAPLPMEMVRHWAYNKLGWLVVPPRQQPVDESDWYNSSDEEPRTMTREEYPDHVESEYSSESEHLSSWESRRSGSEETNSVVVSDYYEQYEMEDTLSSSALSAEDEGNSEDADYYSESE